MALGLPASGNSGGLWFPPPPASSALASSSSSGSWSSFPASPLTPDDLDAYSPHGGGAFIPGGGDEHAVRRKKLFFISFFNILTSHSSLSVSETSPKESASFND